MRPSEFPASPLAGPALTRAFLHYLVAIDLLAATYDEDRHRDLDRRAGHARAIREPAAVRRRSRLARTLATMARTARREQHALTRYPCRLPDGAIGRTMIVLVEGEWTAVCAVA